MAFDDDERRFFESVEGPLSALLSAAEALAAPATLHLCVLEADARARRFYATRGWREGARFRCSVDGGAYLHASKTCVEVDSQRRAP